MKTEEKIEKVKGILKNYEKIALAFSAGADSTLLAYLAKESGCEVLAITYNNQIFPNGFLDFAIRRANELGINHEIIENNFLDIYDVAHNTAQRCLACRRLMYGTIKQYANERGYEIIIDGNNITDLIHDRPGILMKYANGIESPFIDAHLESHEIHRFLSENNIEYSSSTTCLATRIKTNERVTEDKANRIDYCEEFIKGICKTDFVKLREEKNIATIELGNIKNSKRILEEEKLEIIFNELKKAQYDKVLLNIDFNEKDEGLVLESELQMGKENLALRKQLPFGIDIRQTSIVINEEKNDSVNNIETNEDIGYIKLKIDEKESKIFRDGKIVVENNESKDDAKESLVKILPLIRRTAPSLN